MVHIAVGIQDVLAQALDSSVADAGQLRPHQPADASQLMAGLAILLEDPQTLRGLGLGAVEAIAAGGQELFASLIRLGQSARQLLNSLGPSVRIGPLQALTRTRLLEDARRGQPLLHRFQEDLGSLAVGRQGDGPLQLDSIRNSFERGRNRRPTLRRIALGQDHAQAFPKRLRLAAISQNGRGHRDTPDRIQGHECLRSDRPRLRFARTGHPRLQLGYQLLQPKPRRQFRRSGRTFGQGAGRCGGQHRCSLDPTDRQPGVGIARVGVGHLDHAALSRMRSGIPHHRDQGVAPRRADFEKHRA